ncbi:RNA polymerase, subunit L [Trachipleistophora hominis]|uniref:RNA polymerase, subunit L n=1 Tax=Trachipleistophora hominis TaxID=72359 RepID=L7K018_TRAHO|nr:RNA polymerase, subunit L [Trachipleistophora hominis]
MNEHNQKYLHIKYSKNTPNTVELHINGESHTLGNLIAEKILSDPRCTFSAYKVNHPLDEEVDLKVSAQKDTPVLTLIKDNLKSLEDDIESLIAQAKEERKTER